MTKKYIITNCPSLNQARNLCNEIISTCYADYNMGREAVWCEDCTDCLLKKIVEKCREEIRTNDRWSDSRTFAEEILELLEIEECEE